MSSCAVVLALLPMAGTAGWSGESRLVPGSHRSSIPAAGNRGSNPLEKQVPGTLQNRRSETGIVAAGGGSSGGELAAAWRYPSALVI